MRVTKEMLKNKLEHLTRATGLKVELSSAYGGYNVIVSETGRNLLWHDHIKASELMDRLDAFIYGYRAAKGDIHNENR
ncbi:hypothetical protein [Caudoviricetes sp.]|nr:hypothetical protein [Caudoviricetes sp.]